MGTEISPPSGCSKMTLVSFPSRRMRCTVRDCPCKGWMGFMSVALSEKELWLCAVCLYRSNNQRQSLASNRQICLRTSSRSNIPLQKLRV
jgi:hypothetical protein